MDAIAITMVQELKGWRAQIGKGAMRLKSVPPRLLQLAQGGTAVGTGINARPEFGAAVARHLAEHTKLAFVPSDNFFEALSCQDTAGEMLGPAHGPAACPPQRSNHFPPCSHRPPP